MTKLHWRHLGFLVAAALAFSTLNAPAQAGLNQPSAPVGAIDQRIVKGPNGGAIIQGEGGSLPDPANVTETATIGKVGPGEGVEFTSDYHHTNNSPDILWINGEQYGNGDYDTHPVPFTYEDMTSFANDLLGQFGSCNDFEVTYRAYPVEVDVNTVLWTDTNYLGTSTVTVLKDATRTDCDSTIHQRIVKGPNGGSVVQGSGGSVPDPANVTETATIGKVGPGEGVEFTSDYHHTLDSPDVLWINGVQYGNGDYDTHPVPFTYEDMTGFANELLGPFGSCNDFEVTYRTYPLDTLVDDVLWTDSNYTGTSTVTVLKDATRTDCEIDLALNIKKGAGDASFDNSSHYYGPGNESTNVAETAGLGVVNKGEGIEITSQYFDTLMSYDLTPRIADFIGGQAFNSGNLWYYDQWTTLSWDDVMDWANENISPTASCSDVVYTYVAFPNNYDGNYAINDGSALVKETVTFKRDTTRTDCGVVDGIMLPESATTSLDLGLNLNLDLGSSLTDATSMLTGAGLQPNSQYQLILQSTPKLIFEGLTDPNGDINQLVNFANIACPEKGAHTLTLIGTTPEGQHVKAQSFLVIDSKCKLLALAQGGIFKKSTFGGILFDFKSAVLTKQSMRNIRAMAPLLRKAKAIEIWGFTQTELKSAASRKANKKLALQRARAVHAYLNKLNIKAHVQVRAIGARLPVSVLKQYLNRRVTLKVSFENPQN